MDVMKKLYKLEQQNTFFATVIYQLLASLIFSFNGLFVKLLKNYSSAEIVIFRSILTLVFNGQLISYFHYEMYPMSWDIRKKLILRGLCAGIAINFVFTGFKLVPISEGTVLQRTTPVWTALMAIYVLKIEKNSVGTVLIAILSVIGIIFIAQPQLLIDLLNFFGFEYQIPVNQSQWEFHFIGVLLCLTASFLITFSQILISALSQNISQFTILQYFAFFSLFFSVVYLLYIPGKTIKLPNPYELSLLTAIGFIGIAAQYLMNRSLMYGNLTKISLIGQSQVVFSVLIDIIIIREPLNKLSMIGIAIVMSSIFVEILKKKNKK